MDQPHTELRRRPPVDTIAHPAAGRPAAEARVREPLHHPGAPILETQDIAAMALATVMALGPLSAYALGYGL